MIFLEELAQRGIIKEEKISEIVRIADEKYNGNIDESLVSFGIEDKKILELKGSIFNVPVRDIDPKEITSSTLKFIPMDSAKLYEFAPIGLVDGVLEVGITNPENTQAMDALEFISSKINLPFKIFLISALAFKQILEMEKSMHNKSTY